MTVKPREIWEKGTPLNEAWLRFSDSKLRAEYSSEFEYSNVQPVDPEKTFSENAAIFLFGAAKALAVPKRRAILQGRMRDDLQRRLAASTLYGSAFPTWPSEARIPRLIQPHFWVNAKIDWEAETAQDESNRFQKIRVLNPADFPELNLRPKIGRKSYADKITWAISEAEKRNQSFWDFTNKEKTAEIRKLIKSKWPGIKPDGPGLGDDVIRKQINRYGRENNK